MRKSLPKCSKPSWPAPIGLSSLTVSLPLVKVTIDPWSSAQSPGDPLTPFPLFLTNGYAINVWHHLLHSSLLRTSCYSRSGLPVSFQRSHFDFIYSKHNFVLPYTVMFRYDSRDITSFWKTFPIIFTSSGLEWHAGAMAWSTRRTNSVVKAVKI